jgi:tRNA pseudouridine38-40 synthase
VEGELGKALQELAGLPVKCSSVPRTDAGVHAADQLILIDQTLPLPLNKLSLALNAILPPDLRVLRAYSKVRVRISGKEYQYLIFNGEVLPPYLLNFAWQVKPKLNLAKMRKAARFLLGRHDFSAFCAAGGVERDHQKTIHKIVISNSSLVIWTGHKSPILRVTVIGNGFLYKMVRNIVGTLVEVGLGRLRPEEVKKILMGRDRRLAGRTAPPQGLCLTKVFY